MKVFEAGNRLNHLENPSANLGDVFCESTAYVAICYGQKCEAHETMTDVHYKVWISKTGWKGACLLPKLKAIAPTLEVFKENIKRPHFQACKWKAALDEEPPNLDPLKFGWVKHDPAKSFCAVPLPQDVRLASAELLKVIQCMCSSDQTCSSLRCGLCIWSASLFPILQIWWVWQLLQSNEKNDMANDVNDGEEHSDDEDDGGEDDD